MFRALGGQGLRAATRREPKPYAGRVAVYAKLGTGPGLHVWLAPKKAEGLHVGQCLKVYLGPERFSRPAPVRIDGVRDTANGKMWVMEFF